VSTLTKVFVVLTSVLSIALSVLFVAGAAQWGHWRDLVDRYKSERDAAITQRQNVEATCSAALALKDETIAELRRQLAQTQDENDRLTEQLAQLQSELAVVKNERVAFEAGRAKLQEILNVTTGELKAVQKRNQELLAQNMDLQTRNQRLNSRVLELTSNVTILTDQVRNMQEKLYACEQSNAELQRALAGGPGVRPAPGVVRTAAAQAAVAGEIRGEIIAVEGTYASINIGESSGVVPGMTFMVYREGGVYLGDLVIEKVRPKEAGGRLTTLVKGEVRPGDQVIYGLR